VACWPQRAGKSTLLKTLAGLVPLASGAIEFSGPYRPHAGADIAPWGSAMWQGRGCSPA